MKKLITVAAVVAIVLTAWAVDLKINQLNPSPTPPLGRFIFPVEDPLIANWKVTLDQMAGFTLNGKSNATFIAGAAYTLIDGAILTNIVIWTDQYRTQAVTIARGRPISITNALGGIYFYGGTLTASNILATELDVVNFYPTNIFLTITPWAGPTNPFTFGKQRQQYTTTTDMAITSFAAVPPVGIEVGAILSITNAADTNCTLWITEPTCSSDDGLSAYVVTNHSVRKFSLNVDDMGYHVVSRPFQRF